MHNKHITAAIVGVLLIAISSITNLSAYPHGGYGYSGYRSGNWGGYHGGGWNTGYRGVSYNNGWNNGYRGCYNNGGWYGTGIPNGLGWTLFGLGAAGAVASAATLATPVYAPAPVYYNNSSYIAPYNTQTIIEQPRRVNVAPVQSSDGFLAKAQSKLAGLGYYKGSADGIFGPLTAGAIQQFQADNNLPVSGRLDPKTLSSLGLY